MAKDSIQNQKPYSASQKDSTAALMQDVRYIVRIINKDVDGTLPIYRAIKGIKGIGIRMGKIIAMRFEKETGIVFDSPIGELTEQQDKLLEEIILNPKKHGFPPWLFNRQKDWESGLDNYLVMGELDFSRRKDLQRLNEIKSYRGLRLSWGLTVRGQKTRSTHRGKGGVVGVVKKDVKKGGGGGAKPAAASSDKGGKK